MEIYGSVIEIGISVSVSGRRAAILVLPSSAWRALGLTSTRGIRSSVFQPDSPCSLATQRATQEFFFLLCPIQMIYR